jgi:transcriptional regulator with XRE-family HTH domain
MVKLNPTAWNLRYLLWRAGVRREDWASHLASWTGGSEVRAKALLRGANIGDEEQKRVADEGECTVEDLHNEGFWAEQVNVLRENLKYLLDKKQVGEKLSDISRGSGVKQVTLSRWKSGRQEPEDRQLAKLARHFGLAADTNLRTDPVFLSLSPVGELMRREWLHRKVEELDADTLHELFPAFERLMKDS